MLKLPLLELFFRLIPEGFIFIFAGYAFTKTLVTKKKYIISSVLLGTIGYLIRFLPIDYGVHTILSLFACIIIVITLVKIDVVRAISAAIITFILAFISEGINVLIIQFIFKADTTAIFQNPELKIIYGIPSLIIMVVVISIFYYIMLKRNELKYVSNEKHSR